MKHILTVFLFCSSMVFSFGQGRTSVGAEVSFPTGSGSDGVSTGFGAWVRYEKGINKNFAWTVSAGYIYFPASQTETVTIPGSTPIVFSLDGHLSLVPILAGAKFYPKEVFKGIYFGADLGVTPIYFNGTFSYAGYSQSISQNDNKFTVVPSVGVHAKRLDFAFRYTIIDQANFYGGRIGYVLN
jgi:hypothetical protein